MTDTHDRLTELELRYMEQGELVEQLNTQVVEANATIHALSLRVKRLERQLEDLLRAVDAPANEKPPHY
jgi:uncharacterized coiled-coil protein SlyX